MFEPYVLFQRGKRSTWGHKSPKDLVWYVQYRNPVTGEQFSTKARERSDTSGGSLDSFRYVRFQKVVYLTPSKADELTDLDAFDLFGADPVVDGLGLDA